MSEKPIDVHLSVCGPMDEKTKESLAMLIGHSIRTRTSGFEDIPPDEDGYYKLSECRHHEHQPPMHLCIPHGKQYRHVCPGCGHETVLRAPQVNL